MGSLTAGAHEGAYPSRGVVSEGAHQRVRYRVKDIPTGAGEAEALFVEPCFVNSGTTWPERILPPSTERLPIRARCTIQLQHAEAAAVVDSGRVTDIADTALRKPPNQRALSTGLWPSRTSITTETRSL